MIVNNIYFLIYIVYLNSKALHNLLAHACKKAFKASTEIIQLSKICKLVKLIGTDDPACRNALLISRIFGLRIFKYSSFGHF